MAAAAGGGAEKRAGGALGLAPQRRPQSRRRRRRRHPLTDLARAQAIRTFCAAALPELPAQLAVHCVNLERRSKAEAIAEYCGGDLGGRRRVLYVDDDIAELCAPDLVELHGVDRVHFRT